jgi:hypothetical protein
MLYKWKLDSCVRNDETLIFELMIRQLLSDEHWCHRMNRVKNCLIIFTRVFLNILNTKHIPQQTM